ncbi:MAG: tRNA (N6-threonylcarbamoyladenosine(37)-N6)-methyltransferase TrmO, partial [Gammaproteobacteria bacterium]|nr:tRNA (N6-threonylcarbamoyladenosine(37)-N6)-methyltransferase TrmO [Gammaproteobacteria bacterium]NIQ12763.1 tRNA (N6-threonylcarbamoyladenosine(37)-N6)-methyltransferase TrmO [Gammaproteobacteria bacterium]NIR25596.1 tRNA (N6-threonylcarbamoyladenosine(37)-N6)-methyltransferase TrmO [Gammaproteobacteria bacterium]NIY18999.1 tRNA (N6-threonylcarbamoyladenosine(37)-N6)-methyltransferase TrmO [Gammaproteobacteria bacterium]
SARGVAGSIEIREEFSAGLVDLDGFSHLIVIYQFHQQSKIQLTVTPFLDDSPHGIFATRAPCRPNLIGVSLLKLVSIEGRVLTVEDVDMLDMTPLIDIKPYISSFDQPEGVTRSGWFAQSKMKLSQARSDERFCGS